MVDVDDLILLMMYMNRLELFYGSLSGVDYGLIIMQTRVGFQREFWDSWIRRFCGKLVE